MKNRTVLLGLDGATFSIIHPLVDQGIMPFLKKFIASGTCANLRSIFPPLTPPAWTSMITGRTPGYHGVFDFFQKEPDSHLINFVSSQDIKCETIWSIINRNGYRVTALNWPLMMPPPPVEGNLIAGGWMTPRQMRIACYPEKLYDDLKKFSWFKSSEAALNMKDEEKALEGCEREEYEEWIKFHIKRELQWFKILSHLMQNDPCELTAIVFDGVDKLQHLCWRYIAPDQNDSLEPWERRIQDLCLTYFSELDQLLAKIDQFAGPEATIVITSDHGFGPQNEVFFANAWLNQMGYLEWANHDSSNESGNAVFGIGQISRHAYLINWEKTIAYAATPSSNGIHIVVADENTENGIQPSEYHNFRNKLIDNLYAVTHPITQQKLFSKIWTREEIFSGPCMTQGPDLTLELNNGGSISILDSDCFLKTRPSPMGCHHMDGIFMAKGPHIRQNVNLDTLSILDVAPFLLHNLGIAVPKDMEGKVPDALFESGFLSHNPVRLQEYAEVNTLNNNIPQQQLFDAEDEAEMAKRLRALGYIE